MKFCSFDGVEWTIAIVDDYGSRTKISTHKTIPDAFKELGRGRYVVQNALEQVPIELCKAGVPGNAVISGGAVKWIYGHGYQIGHRCQIAPWVNPTDPLRYFAREAQRSLSLCREIAGKDVLSLGATIRILCKDLWPVGRLTPEFAFKIKNSFFGGRCEIREEKAQNIEVSDIASAYAWAASNPVPRTNQVYRLGKRSRPSKEFARFYHANVDVPNCTWPPLPSRWKTRRSEFMVFPWGRVSGWFADIELENAENAGCEVRRGEGLAVRCAPIFKPVVDDLWEKRNQSKEMDDFCKSLLVRIYGQSVSGGASSRLRWPQIPDMSDPKEEFYFCGTKEITRKRIWIPHKALPAGALMTASVRVELHKRLAVGGENVVYCDTDSVHFKNGVFSDPESKTLGAWAHKKQYKTVLYDTLRKYTGVTTDGFVDKKGALEVTLGKKEENYARIRTENGKHHPICTDGLKSKGAKQFEYKAERERDRLIGETKTEARTPPKEPTARFKFG